MTEVQQQALNKLLTHYSNFHSTVSLITFVANTPGILSVIRETVAEAENEVSTITVWLKNQCHSQNISFRDFIADISVIVTTFKPSDSLAEYYATLELEPGVGKEEIKKAYRALSLKYHPDRSQDKNGNYDKFIEITAAYHHLIDQPEHGFIKEERCEEDWAVNGQQIFSQKKFGKQGIIILLAIFCALLLIYLISNSYRSKMMLAGLKDYNDVTTEKSTGTTSETPEVSGLYDEKFQVSEALVHDFDKSIRNSNEDKGTLNNKDMLQTGSVAENLSNVVPEITLSPVSSAGSFYPHDDIKLTDSHQATINQSKNGTKTMLPVIKAQNIKKKVSFIAVDSIPVEKEAMDGSVVAVDVIPQLEIVSQKDKAKPHSSEATQNVDEDLTLPGNENNQRALNNIAASQEDLQREIDTFLDGYINAYARRNIEMFSDLFIHDATENGKPFSEMLPVYKDLFLNTTELNLKVEILQWFQYGEMIKLRGRFKDTIIYLGGERIVTSGPINLILLRQSPKGELKIIHSSYSFDTTQH